MGNSGRTTNDGTQYVVVAAQETMGRIPAAAAGGTVTSMAHPVGVAKTVSSAILARTGELYSLRGSFQEIARGLKRRIEFEGLEYHGPSLFGLPGAEQRGGQVGTYQNHRRI